MSPRPAARSALLLTLLPAALLSACTPERPVSVPEIEAFLGVTLPPGHRDLRSADEAGIDRLMRLTFDAPEADVRAVFTEAIEAARKRADEVLQGESDGLEIGIERNDQAPGAPTQLYCAWST